MTFPAGPSPDPRPARDGGPAARLEADAAGTLAALYDRHAGAAYALAMRIAGEPGAAETIVREVFAAAGRRPGGDLPPAHALLAATRVRAVERLRADAAGESAPAVPDAAGRGVPVAAGESAPAAPADAAGGGVPPRPRPEDAATLRLPEPAGGRVPDEPGPGDAPRLRSAFRALPPLERLAVELAWFEGLTISRIASRLEQTPEAAAARLRTGLLRLAGRVEAPPVFEPRHDAPPARELAGLYALGALNPGERAAFDAHLEAHRESVDEVLLLLPVARRLAWAAPPHEPPPGLRRRVLEAVAGTPLPGAAEPADPDGDGKPRPEVRLPAQARPRPDAPAEPRAQGPSEPADDAGGPATRDIPGAETAAAEPRAQGPSEPADDAGGPATRDIPGAETASLPEPADDAGGPTPRDIPGAETASLAGPAPAPGAWKKGRRRALSALAAAGLVAAAGLGLLASRQSALATALQENLDAANTQARIAELETEAAQRIADELRGGAGVLTAGGVRTLDLAGQPAAPEARGRLFRSAGGGAFFAAAGLPPLPPGRVYQLWFIPDAAPIAAALLSVDAEGRAMAAVTLPERVTEDVPAALTQESAGGVERPAGNVYLLGRP